MLRRLIEWHRLRRQLRRLRSAGLGLEIEPKVQFVFPERISLGSYVYVGPNAYLNGRGGLTVGDHAILAPEVAILTSMHRYREATMVPYDHVELLRPVVVERCVWIGMRAMILPGVTLGEGSIVGAGAVVTKSCDPGSIVAGNPARLVGRRDMEQYQRCTALGGFYLLKKRREGWTKAEQVDRPGKSWT